jgi:hypothetical protein
MYQTSSRESSGDYSFTYNHEKEKEGERERYNVKFPSESPPRNRTGTSITPFMPSSTHTLKQKRSFCNKLNHNDKFEIILDDISDLTIVQKNILRTRYIDILREFKKRALKYSFCFYTGHFVITVGSLIVPGLLSIQFSEPNTVVGGKEFQVWIYWVTWTVSLLVTTFNGILTLFKIDKKYFFLNTAYERLKSEGWQFFELTGRYSGQLLQNNEEATHGNQFIYFCHYIEKIKLKQVEEEYFKPEDKASAPTTVANRSQTGAAGMEYPPSINKPIRNLTDNIPVSVKDAVNSIIMSASTLNNNTNNSIDGNMSTGNMSTGNNSTGNMSTGNMSTGNISTINNNIAGNNAITIEENIRRNSLTNLSTSSDTETYITNHHKNDRHRLEVIPENSIAEINNIRPNKIMSQPSLLRLDTGITIDHSTDLDNII